MEKMSRAERARQFMPFSPLRGYDELLLSKTREPTPKRELSEYDAKKQKGGIARAALLSLRVTFISALPIAGIFMTYPEEIAKLLYTHTELPLSTLLQTNR